MQGNQWLEDSALENPDVDKDDNFYPPETAGHKFVESDDDISHYNIRCKKSKKYQQAQKAQKYRVTLEVLQRMMREKDKV